MDSTLTQFADKFLSDLEERSAAVFAGAGLSVSAGYVNWHELLRPLALDLNLDVDRETDLISLAQFHVNANGRHQLSQQILDKLAQKTAPTRNHEILARLPIETYWTTNYDKLIERSLDNSGKTPDVKYTNNQLALTKRGRDATVFKMHGDVDHADAAIMTKDDYERYLNDHGAFVNALSGDLVSKTFLFLGFSLTDPNLDYILSRIRLTFQQHQRQHYCIFRRVSRSDYDDSADYHAADTKQQLMIRDLQRFNIKTLLVDEYAQITDLLELIERRYRRSTIFLSGSAHDFSPWTRTQVESFLYRLGEVLIDHGYRLACGLGLGVGNAFVTGAITRIYETQDLRLEDRLTLRPFPQHIEDPHEREAAWTQYRDQMLARSGIAIFFSGNKYADDQVVEANGVLQEFELSHQHSVAPVPIGSSAWAAHSIWHRVVNNLDQYYSDSSGEIARNLEALNETHEDPNQLIEPIVDLVNRISKE